MPTFAPPTLLDGPRWAGMRIGLLGGSFDPPHHGHLHISQAALKALGLDCVWWLVTPQNPIKSLEPLPLEQRVELCKELAQHPRIIVSDIEAELGTTTTYHSVKALKANFPRTEFVWISGMDNAFNLHKWNEWRALLGEIAFLHLARNPARSLAQGCPLKMYARQKHVVLHKSGRYPLDSGTSYWMMQQKMVNISSSEIRTKSKLYQ